MSSRKAFCVCCLELGLHSKGVEGSIRRDMTDSGSTEKLSLFFMSKNRGYSYHRGFNHQIGEQGEQPKCGAVF